MACVKTQTLLRLSKKRLLSAPIYEIIPIIITLAISITLRGGFGVIIYVLDCGTDDTTSSGYRSGVAGDHPNATVACWATLRSADSNYTHTALDTLITPILLSFI